MKLRVGVGGFSKVVGTLGHVHGSFNRFMATTGDFWIIPSFQIWGYVLHVEHVSCVITNCCQHQWVIPSPLNSYLGLTEEIYYEKITVPILRLILKKFIFPGCFICMLFTPQPFWQEGYCHHNLGGWAGVQASGWLPNLRNPYLCNRLTDFLHSKFCGIV